MATDPLDAAYSASSRLEDCGAFITVDSKDV